MNLVPAKQQLIANNSKFGTEISSDRSCEAYHLHLCFYSPEVPFRAHEEPRHQKHGRSTKALEALFCRQQPVSNSMDR